MEIYLNKNIKEIINQFPNAADVLNEYDIACAPCNVGTCLLKDVVEVHNLSAEAENELLKKIAGIIFPEKKVEIPKLQNYVSAQALRPSFIDLPFTSEDLQNAFIDIPETIKFSIDNIREFLRGTDQFVQKSKTFGTKIFFGTRQFVQNLIKEKTPEEKIEKKIVVEYTSPPTPSPSKGEGGEDTIIPSPYEGEGLGEVFKKILSLQCCIVHIITLHFKWSFYNQGKLSIH